MKRFRPFFFFPKLNCKVLYKSWGVCGKRQSCDSKKSTKAVLGYLRNLFISQEACLLTSEVLSLKSSKSIQDMRLEIIFHIRALCRSTFLPHATGEAKEPCGWRYFGNPFHSWVRWTILKSSQQRQCTSDILLISFRPSLQVAQVRISEGDMAEAFLLLHNEKFLSSA